MNTLFVGGPWHGLIIRMKELPPVWKVAEYPYLTYACDAGPIATEPPVVSIHEYKRRQFHTHNGRRFMYVSTDSTDPDDDALCALLDALHDGRLVPPGSTQKP